MLKTKDYYDHRPVEINLCDSIENINATRPGFYENVKVKFYTLDINVKRLTNNEIFESDPWFLFQFYSDRKKHFECEFKKSIDDKYRKFVSLNFGVRPHRVELLQFLRLEKINCYYSDIDNGITLTEMPECFINGYYKNKFDYGVPREYFLSLIDIVTEGSFEMSTHFSEKTFKSLFYKKPFICLAGPYWYQEFAKEFELYDEIFNYEFDTVEDPEQRIEMIFSQIKNLDQFSYEELSKKLNSILPKIEYNNKKLFEVKSKIYGKGIDINL